ncbi:MAG: methenyltetrahydromethanopterin cyclohydrolase [Aeoliella sp.]
MAASRRSNLELNNRAAKLCDTMVEAAADLRIEVANVGATRIIDCGVNTTGGLEVGRRMARISLAGMGDVSFAVHPLTGGPAVMVRTDAPVAACMASQYAGWEVKGDDFFAMGSGPMRSAYGGEELFDEIGCREHTDVAVGLLESGEMPPQQVCDDIALKCGASPENLTLLVAPTNCQAGNVQVVARSVETALHKLHELSFDLHRVESGWGIAPLPPVAGDALTGIGRTNDAILYGGHVVLYVRGEDAHIEEVGPKTPSSASSDHGRPFRDIFSAYDHEFYKIDKHLFSPAIVEFVNLDTGRSWRFGEYVAEVLEKSFEVSR